MLDTIRQLQEFKSKILGVLEMTNWAINHTLLPLSLNGIDVVFAFFLVLGGWNLTVTHPVAG